MTTLYIQGKEVCIYYISFSNLKVLNIFMSNSYEGEQIDFPKHAGSEPIQGRVGSYYLIKDYSLIVINLS